MKVLLTGFEPFGGQNINPAAEIIRNLNRGIGDVNITGLQVPTVFHACSQQVIDKINEINPQIVLCLGQAGGRPNITIERVAINIDDTDLPDNAHQQPVDVPIDPEGETAYFSNLPVKEIVRALRMENIPASISNSAGTYVCNHLMYSVLHHIYRNGLDIKAGFIHVPFLPEQVLEKSFPAMPLEMMIEAIKIAIQTIVK